MVDFFAVTGKAYWRADALLSLSLTQQDGALVTAVTVNTGWGSGDAERRPLLRKPLNQYCSL